MDPKEFGENPNSVEAVSAELQRLVKEALESDYAQTTLSNTWMTFFKEAHPRVLSRYIFYKLDEANDTLPDSQGDKMPKLLVGIIAEGYNFNPENPKISAVGWPDRVIVQAVNLRQPSMILNVHTLISNQGKASGSLSEANPNNLFNYSDKVSFGPIWNAWREAFEEIAPQVNDEVAPSMSDLLTVLKQGSLDRKSIDEANRFLEDNLHGINIHDPDTLISVTDYLQKVIGKSLPAIEQSVTLHAKIM